MAFGHQRSGQPADCVLMQAGATFADILDASLGGAAAAPRPRAWSTRAVTPPLFAFELPLQAVAAAACVPNTGFPVAGLAGTPNVRSGAAPDPNHPHPPVPAGEVPPPPRPAAASKIRLTTLEARALAALNALGAELDTLSPDSLRRAFRRLAQRYHPDRHPGSSAADTARLARQFAEATAHYRLLAAGLERRFL
jgi:hypothetical protein